MLGACRVIIVPTFLVVRFDNLLHRCKYPFGGLYCETALAQLPDESDGSQGWVIAIVIIVLLLCILVFAVLYVTKHGLNMTWR